MSRTCASTLDSCIVFSLRGELHQLDDERVRHHLANIVLARRPALAQQVGHADLQRPRQAAPATTASASPSRSRSSRRTCAARPCASPVAAGSGRCAGANCGSPSQPESPSDRLRRLASAAPAGVRIGSGSSSSSDARHRRQRLLVVLNWTRWQSSHLTTSRFSTGARVVAMLGWECQSGHPTAYVVLCAIPLLQSSNRCSGKRGRKLAATLLWLAIVKYRRNPHRYRRISL